MKITLEISDGKIMILIDGLAHVIIKQNELMGIHSWMEGDKHPCYWIEYILRRGRFSCSYDKIDKWKEILKLLKDADLFECL